MGPRILRPQPLQNPHPRRVLIDVPTPIFGTQIVHSDILRIDLRQLIANQRLHENLLGREVPQHAKDVAHRHPTSRRGLRRSTVFTLVA